MRLKEVKERIKKLNNILEEKQKQVEELERLYMNVFDTNIFLRKSTLENEIEVIEGEKKKLEAEAEQLKTEYQKAKIQIEGELEELEKKQNTLFHEYIQHVKSLLEIMPKLYAAAKTLSSKTQYYSEIVEELGEPGRYFRVNYFALTYLPRISGVLKRPELMDILSRVGGVNLERKKHR